MKTAVLALDPTYVDTFAEGIDESVWKIWGKPWDSYVTYDRGVIRAAQVTTRDGELVISMDRRTTPRTFKGDPDTQRDWDTGWVSTQESLGFVHGAYEVEAMVPAAENVSAGVWAAIWSRTFDKNIKGEIDVMESFGYGGEGARPGASVAEGFTTTVHYTQDSSIKHKSKLIDTPLRPLSADYHKYGVYKSADEIVIYFDREEIHRVTRAENPAAFDAAFPPGVPFDVRLCIQAGGEWGGWPTTETAHHSEMRIRKVTIWNFDPAHVEQALS